MPFVTRLSHRAQGKPYVAPMEMNAYDLDRVPALFQDHGLSRVRLSLSRMGPIRSATILGVRDSAASPR